MPVGFNVANPDRTGAQSVRDSLSRAAPMEAFGERLRAQHAGNVNSLGQEQGRLAAGANAAVQQKFQTPGGGSFANKLEQNVRRSRARQGILNRGDKAIRNQQLKDRLQLAKSSVARRGIIQNSAANAEQIKTGVAASKQAASDKVGSAIGGAAGFIAGGALRGFGDNLFGGIDPVEVDTMDAGNVTGGGFGMFGGY